MKLARYCSHHDCSFHVDLTNSELQVVAVISAMKMEMAVQTSLSGTVRATHVTVGDKIDPEDLLVEIQEAPE